MAGSGGSAAEVLYIYVWVTCQGRFSFLILHLQSRGSHKRTGSLSERAARQAGRQAGRRAGRQLRTFREGPGPERRAAQSSAQEQGESLPEPGPEGPTGDVYTTLHYSISKRRRSQEYQLQLPTQSCVFSSFTIFQWWLELTEARSERIEIAQPFRL